MKALGSISVFLSFLNTVTSYNQLAFQYYLVVFSYSATALIVIIESLINLENEIKRIRIMSRWSPVTAIVLKSRIVVESHSSLESVQILDLEYTYNVKGTAYRSKSIAKYFIDHFRLDLAERIIEKFPEGSETHVYFNPENPGEAVLMHREHATCIINCIFLCLFWIGVMIVCSLIVIGFVISWVSIILLLVFLSIYIPARMKRQEIIRW